MPEVDENKAVDAPVGAETGGIPHAQDPAGSTDGKPGPEQLQPLLDELSAAVVAMRAAQERVRVLGFRLRDMGASWSQLARASGFSQQAARQRWTADGNRKHRQAQKARAERATQDGGR